MVRNLESALAAFIAKMVSNTSSSTWLSKMEAKKFANNEQVLNELKFGPTYCAKLLKLNWRTFEQILHRKLVLLYFWHFWQLLYWLVRFFEPPIKINFSKNYNCFISVGSKSGVSSDTSPPLQSFAEESSPENRVSPSPPMSTRILNGQSTESLDSFSDESGGHREQRPLRHSTPGGRRGRTVRSNPVPPPRKVFLIL